MYTYFHSIVIRSTFIFFFVPATAKFPPEKFQTPDDKKGGPSQPQPNPGPKKMPLNSGDQLYNEIRDLNFLAVGPVLSKKAKQISAAFEVCTKF